jgi:hypothetical protein
VAEPEKQESIGKRSYYGLQAETHISELLVTISPKVRTMPPMRFLRNN